MIEYKEGIKPKALVVWYPITEKSNICEKPRKDK